ncbi:dynactin subunit 1 isoform X3 [Folsomia candida]|uniref:dynactin subunit 1 isoform X3 n=1 Tax=Folsomia candida TaxID=158441 RepID=UPI00160555AC|nr:dynactin subunit 1 isoform X3 [Folsomia candida]
MGEPTVGSRVEIVGRDGAQGTVAFVGSTTFASGKWVGVALDEAKGKNDGSVNGTAYFDCPPNHGIFVRMAQITLVGDEGTKSKLNSPAVSSLSPEDVKSGGSSGGGKAKGSSSKHTSSQVQRRTQVTRLRKVDLNLDGLPVAGAKEVKPLQSTPSGSRSNLSTPSTKVDPSSGPSKRNSFVETGFAPSEREIVPQYTPGTPASVMATPTTPMTQSEDRFTAVHDNAALRAEVKDLNEKLDTLKAKRANDVEKLRELDRFRLEVETLSEFRTKVLESQAALQKELKRAKNETREAIEAKERHAEEMSDLSEAVEMATLDKEMAEEKAETLQLELDQANEKAEQYFIELKTMKDELSGKINIESGEAGVTSFQVKQLQAENSRLKEALVKFRDATAHDKHLHQKTIKDLETVKTELKEALRSKESFEIQVLELEEQVADLQDQTEAALGAEEMVENLTEKNLNLEEKVNQLTETVADLEALHDVNDQLQESAKELEMELRDDLQQSQTIIQNTVRERDAMMETVADLNSTILKFREVVQKMTDENTLLRQNLEEESSKSSIPGLVEDLAFKKVFAETKAQTTATELELRRIEAKEATLHSQYLAQAVKTEMDQTRNLKIQLEDKEASIKELHKILKAKQEELSEASIRKELAEKRLSNATKDSEMTIEKLTRKLEDLQSVLQRKEREFEATLEHFQSDIESLQMERGELKDKLLSVTKERFFKELVSGIPSGSSPMHSPSVGHTPVQSAGTPMLSSGGSIGASSDSLIEYTRYLQRQNWRLQSQQLIENLRKLPPIQLPKKSDDVIKQMEKELSQHKMEITSIVCDSFKISFDSNLSASRKEYLLHINELRKSKLAEKMGALQHKINAIRVERKCPNIIRGDFASFPSERSIKDAENELIKVGSIKFPGWEKSKEKPQCVIVSDEELFEIHKLLTPNH